LAALAEPLAVIEHVPSHLAQLDGFGVRQVGRTS
jgi:hypothetical protein